MAKQTLGILIWICFLGGFGDGWRAVPANEAMYAMRSSAAGIDADLHAPRDRLHSIYKFGYCAPHALSNKYLRSTVNMSFESREDSMGDYLYLISDMNTERFVLQCVVMKFYTPRKFLFWKSRIPLYYCQGQLYMLMMGTVHRLAIHEFYLRNKLNMPLDIFWEFYQPRYL